MCAGAEANFLVVYHSCWQYTKHISVLVTMQEPLNRGASTSTRLAALERENLDMKTQIANLNARLAQHAQHAEQLLAGTEAFFGDKAGTVIGQPLEEEDSDSNMSFSSAQERSFSRPMSAASSYTSAASKELSSSSPRYATTWLSEALLWANASRQLKV